ncbi:hypothetical protein AAON49_08330 [Pseudotenacibaculum sp. MALMAid0570]|uniref:hypothetical protein n=1 Tax=Pseudotenacibaculum sp. MALMAid0570 TaxID=3143938 RepID=UPI0032DE3C8E
MKKYKLLLIIILLIHVSCSNRSRNKELVGEYKSKKLDLTEKIKYKTTKNIEGFTLSLKEDNLFEYNTCGILVDGSWEVLNDSLVLNATALRFANDSINKIRKPKERKDFLIFKIEGESLIGFVDGLSGLVINKLERFEK